MEITMRILMAIALLCGPVAFGQSAEPTTQEIEEAYRSKKGGTFIPGLRWNIGASRKSVGGR